MTEDEYMKTIEQQGLRVQAKQIADKHGISQDEAMVLAALDTRRKSYLIKSGQVIAVGYSSLDAHDNP